MGNGNRTKVYTVRCWWQTCQLQLCSAGLPWPRDLTVKRTTADVCSLTCVHKTRCMHAVGLPPSILTFASHKFSRDDPAIIHPWLLYCIVKQGYHSTMSIDINTLRDWIPYTRHWQMTHSWIGNFSYSSQDKMLKCYKQIGLSRLASAGAPINICSNQCCPCWRTMRRHRLEAMHALRSTADQRTSIPIHELHICDCK